MIAKVILQRQRWEDSEVSVFIVQFMCLYHFIQECFYIVLCDFMRVLCMYFILLYKAAQVGLNTLHDQLDNQSKRQIPFARNLQALCTVKKKNQHIHKKFITWSIIQRDKPNR